MLAKFDHYFEAKRVVILGLALIGSLSLALLGHGARPSQAQEPAKGGAQTPAELPKKRSTEDWLAYHQQWLETLEKQKNEILKENEKLREDLGKATKAIAAEEKAREEADRVLRGSLEAVALNNPPVGSVVAHAGPWPPREAEVAGLDRKQWEKKVGWALCDGGEFDRLDYSALFKVLGDSKFPDYRGLFLRGLDPSGKVDVDRESTARVVGGYQASAVGPHQHAVTVSGGDHDHAFSWSYPKLEQNDDDDDGGPDHYYARSQVQTTQSGRTAKSGSLSMSGTTESPNSGNGSETRPKNRAVNYLIKLR